MDQDRFAGFKRTTHEDVVPYSEYSLGQGSGLDHRQALRDGQVLPLGYESIFGVTASGDQGADFFTCSDDFASDLQPRCIGDAGRGRVFPHSLQQVRAVHARGMDFYQHLVRIGVGDRNLLNFKDFWPAKGADFDGFHDLLRLRCHVRSLGGFSRSAQQENHVRRRSGSPYKETEIA